VAQAQQTDDAQQETHDSAAVLLLLLAVGCWFLLKHPERQIPTKQPHEPYRGL
jgi:hypothetical protein